VRRRFIVKGWIYPGQLVATWIGDYRWRWRARLAAWWWNRTHGGSVDAHAYIRDRLEPPA
jgi:hypothetical protein